MEHPKTKLNWKSIKFLHRQEINGSISTTEIVRTLSDSKQLLDHIEKTLQEETLDWNDFCIIMDLISILLDHAQSGSEVAKEALLNLVSNHKKMNFLKYVATSFQMKFNSRGNSSIQQSSLDDLNSIQSSFEKIDDLFHFLFNNQETKDNKEDKDVSNNLKLKSITKRYLVEISNLANAFAERDSNNGEFYFNKLRNVYESISRLSNSFCDNAESISYHGFKIKSPYDGIISAWQRSDINQELVPNKMSGYASVKEYLRIHYNLLLEDFLYPLKQDLEKLKNMKFESRDQLQIDSRSMNGLWYHGQCTVHGVQSEKVSYSPISVKIKLDAVPFRMADLETSKKLLPGSMVLLICDKKTLVTATISARDQLSLEQDKSIEIIPIVPYDDMAHTIHTLLCIKKYHLFESSIYFEAYNHVLKSLNRMKKLPPDLETCFIDANKYIEPPVFLKDRDLSKMHVDISCLYNEARTMKTKSLLSSSMELYKLLHEQKETKDDLEINSGKNSISLHDFLNLNATKEKNLRVNESQLKSIQAVFNHRMNLIQGPPGTGKSYVGKLLLSILLKNRHLYESQPSPILLVCYTNRALDSFLEDMLDVTNKIIRIGGRSKSDVLEIHNLASIKAVMRENRLRDGKLHGAIKEAQAEVSSLNLKELIDNAYNDLSSIKSNSQHLKWSDRCKKFDKATKKLHEINLMEDVQLLEKADIIGMTTSGAAKNSKLLKMLVNKCKIVLIEEAGQVLESHVVTALPPKCKQLILIGDHQQLRPSISTYHLGKNYGLDISLFERFIKNDFPYTQLLEQHRMRPEIAKIMSTIFYNGLKNHPSVSRYPQQVYGLGKNMFFLNHNYLEEGCRDASTSKDDVIAPKSKVNMHEALMLLHMARYLIENGYQKTKVTILTTYLGQLFELRKLQHEQFKDMEGIGIQVVDNFQGEENDIILLSLVRSNQEGSIGFLSVQSRICVALSRARMGLYIIGNMAELASASKVWRSIQALLMESEMIGDCIQLFCKIHNTPTKSIQVPEDFEKLTNKRGCEQICNEVLRCGHICDLPCHVEDRSHTGELGCCKRDCEKLCSEGHPCQKKCYERCYPCEHLGDPITLKCGHVIPEPCPSNNKSYSQNNYKCKEFKTKVLDCGHSIQIFCSDSGSTTSFNQCTSTCDFILPCGHPCNLPCHYDESGMGSSHHNKKCMFACKRYKVKCRLQKHVCDKLCYQNPCNLCTVIIPETILPNCKHVHLNLECHQDPSDIFCIQTCEKPLENCLHFCKSECGSCKNVRKDKNGQMEIYKICPPCTEIVEKDLNCGRHTILMQCSELYQKYSVVPPECHQKCDKIIPECGHPCQRYCGEPCGGCEVLTMSSESSQCGHPRMVKCGEESDETSVCNQKCNKKMSCGHICERICWTECINGKLHAPCKQPCQRRLICGHDCNGVCGEPCLPCEGGKRCIVQTCSHKKCKSKCDDPCKSGCKEKCGMICPHSGGTPCTKKCGHSSACSGRKSRLCREFCDKKLKCGHSCKGYCGERCQTTESCPECNDQSFVPDTDQMNRYVSFDCGHSFPKQRLIKAWCDDKNLVGILSCLICDKPISYIGKGLLADLSDFMMYKKDAVTKVFEEYFVLKSTLEQKKKELIVSFKNIIKKINDDQFIDDSRNLYDKKNLREFYSNAVKRCEDRRNIPSFAEIAQFEIKDWILQYIFQSQITIETLTKEESTTILDAIVGIEESGIAGKYHKAPPIGNIGMDYVRSIIYLIENKNLKRFMESDFRTLDLPKTFICFSRGSWEISAQEDENDKEEIGDQDNNERNLESSGKVIRRKVFCVYFKLYQENSYSKQIIV